MLTSGQLDPPNIVGLLYFSFFFSVAGVCVDI